MVDYLIKQKIVLKEIIKMVNIYQEDFTVYPILHNLKHYKSDSVICSLILLLK